MAKWVLLGFSEVDSLRLACLLASISLLSAL
jgi:hypothetical protein